MDQMNQMELNGGLAVARGRCAACAALALLALGLGCNTPAPSPQAAATPSPVSAAAPTASPRPSLTPEIKPAVTPAPTPRPTGAPTIAGPPGAAAALAGVRADLARRRQIAEAQVRLLRAEAVDWPDSSLGCPQPGMMYLQVITPGYRLVLEAGGMVTEYHTDAGVRFVICPVAP